MTKNDFYRRKELFEAEGGVVYDALNSSRIPIATRKLLLKNNVDISVDGNELVIADKRVQVGNAAGVKDLIEAVHETLRERDDREAKKDKQIEKLKDQIRHGTDELKDLQKTVDALTDDTPFARSLMKAVGSLSDLRKEVRELPEAERLQRGEDDLKTFASLYFQLRGAYGVSTPLAQPISVTSESSFADKVAAELAKDDLSEVE
jgi:chromosome segregation ATPase